jgi:hypothetical protein
MHQIGCWDIKTGTVAGCFAPMLAVPDVNHSPRKLPFRDMQDTAMAGSISIAFKVCDATCTEAIISPRADSAFKSVPHNQRAQTNPITNPMHKDKAIIVIALAARRAVWRCP